MPHDPRRSSKHTPATFAALPWLALALLASACTQPPRVGPTPTPPALLYSLDTSQGDLLYAVIGVVGLLASLLFLWANRSDFGRISGALFCGSGLVMCGVCLWYAFGEPDEHYEVWITPDQRAQIISNPQDDRPSSRFVPLPRLACAVKTVENTECDSDENMNPTGCEVVYTYTTDLLDTGRPLIPAPLGAWPHHEQALQDCARLVPLGIRLHPSAR